ncbi:hypothetical protein FRC17_003462 [Serendipita sp. 399]|nr:hypothetical protein FRC17_003462 [Serendipita sp. 399]
MRKAKLSRELSAPVKMGEPTAIQNKLAIPKSRSFGSIYFGFGDTEDGLVSSSTPANDRLPPELLELIFAHLPQHFPCIGFKRGVISPDSWGVAQVCKSWHGPATRAVYAAVEVASFDTASRLLGALEKYPHLRTLIRTLVLPMTNTPSSPPRGMRIFLCIINCLDMLDEVGIVVPYTSSISLIPRVGKLPGELKKHSKLTSLWLNGYWAEESPLPSGLTQTFTQLRYLNLDGVLLDIKPSLLHPLPYLRTVVCTHWKTLSFLEEWLLDCPMLHELYFQNLTFHHDQRALRICSAGKFTRLGLIACSGWIPAPPDGLADMLSKIRALEISTSTFAHFYPHLPRDLDELKLDLNDSGPNVIDAIVGYLNDAVLGRLLLVVDEHQPWFLDHKEEIFQLCSERRVTLQFEFRPCNCKAGE